MRSGSACWVRQLKPKSVRQLRESVMPRSLPMALRQRIDNSEFIFPAFKFLSSEHARRLLDNGNVHLPTIQEFRDPRRYKGKIVDPREGQVKLVSRYTHYEGLAKNANGTLSRFYPPNQRLDVLNTEWAEELDFASAHIYCATRFFYSDSLEWAIGEKKDSCVLITDFEAFLRRVSDALDDLQFLGVRECLYIGRDIEETDPGPNSLANYLLADLRRIAFVKPKKYASQRELRAVWQRADGASEFEAINLDVPSVRDLCIPMDFSNVRRELLLNCKLPGVALGVRIVRKPPGVAAEYLLQAPLEVFSPVIFRSRPEERWLLGCYYSGEERTFANGHTRNAEIGITISRIGPIFCCVHLDQIQRLEFFHVQGAA